MTAHSVLNVRAAPEWGNSELYKYYERNGLGYGTVQFVPSAAELSDAPPENKQDWLHPVIFELQNKIQLTHSTYQVTTFLDFAPFMNGFDNVQNYIRSFKEDVSDPTYFSKIKHKSTNTDSLPLLDEQDLGAFMQSAYCPMHA